MQVFGESLGFRAGEQAREAEERGYDGIVAVDHFYSARAPNQAKWRAQPFIALGAAAATTTRIRLAAMVVNVNFHHPAVIAHAVATLDHLSDGRAELGLGSGWYEPEHAAFGLPWGEASERVARLLECARICRAMFENRGVVSHQGDHFHVENSVPWEWARRAGAIPIIIGGARLAFLSRGAEVANRIDLLHATVDGTPVVDELLGRSLQKVEGLLQSVRAHAAAVGNSLTVSATLTATIVPVNASQAARSQLAPHLKSTEALLQRDLLYVVGSQAELVEKIRLLAALGVDRVHIIPGPLNPGETAAALREMLHEIQQVSS